MAHYLRPLILAVLALVVWPVATAISAVEHFVWPNYQPDTKISIDLDRIGHVIETADVPLRSRVGAFFARCLNHDLFSDGRFHIDPGRNVA